MVNKRKYHSDKERHTAKADAEKRRRANADKETKDAKKAQERNRLAAVRAAEDEATATRRRELTKVHNHLTRMHELPEVTDVRREESKNRMAATRAAEDDVVAAARRERDRNAKSAARNRENVSSSKFYNDKFKDNEVQIHYCGAMDVACEHCNALHFEGERTSADGKFSSCCRKGKVILPPKKEVPEYLKEILSNSKHDDYTNFQDNIRSYNSALSFASMGAENEELPGRGPYCFRVNGQIRHCTSNYHPNDDEPRQFAQLYVVDSSEANVIRSASKANVRCVTEIMTNLDKIIRENNVFAKAYQMLGDIEKAEKERFGETHDVNIVFKRDRNADRRRYNLPTCDEVAMIFKNSIGEPPFERDFRVYPFPNQPLINLNILSPNLDPMTYPLFFPFGEAGWQPGVDLLNREITQKTKISMLQYKVAQTAVRAEIFNPILHGGKLFQQWIVDSYLQVEANNLNWIRYHQSSLKVEHYKGLHDHLSTMAENEGARVGKTVILPSTFQGSPRNMTENYHDAVSLVRQFGKPDLFITMTCNPKWQEIQENLYEGQKASDRPDLVARVFSLKLKACMDDLIKEGVFGKAVANCYSIEFQKRGLPHAHILIILEKDHKLSAEDFDRIVCAELPDKDEEPELFEIVKSCMIHGPCGKNKEDAPCMENGKCMKDYPKKFNEETKADASGYPEYRRREGPTVVSNGHVVDNRNVIPYNKFLTKKFNCHINVEICVTFKSVKYLFKYIYKGYDSIKFTVDKEGEEINYDEIKNFVDARYVSAPEAMWRLLENKMHGISHHIIRLPVHLEQQQMIYFREGEERNALERAKEADTQLTAWFKLNQKNEEARKHLYTEIPYHYTFNKSSTTWENRKQGGGKVIPRMYSVSPKDVERYYLRRLLLNVPGATSFEDLRTVDGVLYDSYKKAAEVRHLIMDDSQWRESMHEADVFQMPCQLRSMFAFICAFNQLKDPLLLYEDFKESMTEDYRQKWSEEIAESLALTDIESILKTQKVTLSQLGLPNPVLALTDSDEVVNLGNERKAQELVDTLNEEQRYFLDQVVQAIYDDDGWKCFFLDGPGGSGKTYLYNTLMYFLRSKGKSVLGCATTGIAADLLSGGRTMHSLFGLPLKMLENSTSSMRIPSKESEDIKNASLLIIDETSSMHKNALKIIDLLLREIMQIDKPFGGKVIICGGDFRQTANIIHGGKTIDIIEASIKNSHLWRKCFKVFHLNVNMRAKGDEEFNNWLLRIGNGDDGDIVEIPEEMIVKDNIVEEIFGRQLNLSVEDLQRRAILTTTNKDAYNINNNIIKEMPGEETIYTSIDALVDETENLSITYPIEFLNKQNPTGIPPHILKVKVGAVIMLIRNLSIKKGLLNGTRLIVLSLHQHFVEAEILTGSKKGNVVYIPRIDLESNENVLPFIMRRRQFPFIVAFAVTINKAQGQTYETVGLYLPDTVFSHGQLYVALSRTQSRKNLKISMKDNENQGVRQTKYVTKNIVIKELL